MRVYGSIFLKPRFIRVWTFGLCLLFSGASWGQGAQSSGNGQAINGQAIALQLELGRHSAPVRRLSVDPRRDLVVTASDDGTARLSSLDGSNKLIMRPYAVPGQAMRLYGAAIHPSKLEVALGGTLRDESGKHRIDFFSLETGRLLRSIDARGGDIKNLKWSADGNFLLATYDGDHGFRAFAPDGRMIFERAFGAGSYGLSVVGSRIAVSSLDGTVHLFEASPDGIRALGDPINTRAESASRARLLPVGVALSPDGSRVAIAYLAGFPQIVVIYSVERRAIVGQISPSQVQEGNQMTVAWSADGRYVFTGGTGYRMPSGRFIITRFDGSTYRPMNTYEVADNSLQDFVALPDGRLLFGAFDGSWGILAAEPQGGSVTLSGETLKYVWNTATFKLSEDTRQISAGYGPGAQTRGFAFDQRLVAQQAVGPLREPVIERNGQKPIWDLRSAEIRATRPKPVIAGKTLDLAESDVSYALSFVGSGAEMVLGTAQALYKLSASGDVLWRVAMRTEVRAVNTSLDGRLIVTAMADGTVRWWRASDGAELLALFTDRQGQWVAWTPAGFFDSSAGADQLAGWAVGHGRQAEMDFFKLNRFRERFRRPDIIDRIFQTADLAAAITAANAALPAAIAASGVELIASAAPPSKVTRDQVPPAIVPVSNLELVDTSTPAIDRQFELNFAVRSSAPTLAVSIELRVDGRPARAERISAPASFDGKSKGFVLARIPPDAVSVQLFAKNTNGVSEPLSFSVTRRDTAAVPLGLAKGKRLFLLAVGVSDYRREAYKLDYAAKDARDFTSAMLAQDGRAYSKVEVRSLLDREASRAQILDGLLWLKRTVQRGDVGIVFLAGHGLNSPNNEYYFVPWDGEHERLSKTGVSQSDLRLTLSTLAGQAMLFVDTCFAENAGRTAFGKRREAGALGSDLAAAENGVVVLASSTGQQESEEKREWGNGAFTKALIEAFSGSVQAVKDKGRLTFGTLKQFVKERVASLTSGRQTPVSIEPPGAQDLLLATL